MVSFFTLAHAMALILNWLASTQERLNGEFCDREKVSRVLKKDGSLTISGFKLYHNYVRPHMGLDGDTPANRAGIDIRGDDR